MTKRVSAARNAAINAWMRRWSWALAMGVAIVITVGGLVILESGRLRIAREYETAVQARTASAELAGLLNDAATRLAGERGYLLTHDPMRLQLYYQAEARAERRITDLQQYYRRHGDAASRADFTSAVGMLRQDREAANDALRAGAIAAAPPAAIAPATQRGLDGLTRLNEALSALVASELRRADQALDASRADQRASTLCVSAVSALNIVLFVLLFRNLGIQIDKQTQAQRELLAQRRELDRLVHERTAQLEALAWHLQSVSEDEKRQLARELHDELGAILTATKMDVAWVLARLKAREPALGEKLVRAQETLDQGIALKRRIIEDMRPTVLANFGLAAALETLASEAAQRNGWSLHLNLPDNETTLAEPLAIALFRVAQEAITNAAKYAKATHLTLALDIETGPVPSATLDIVDNGVGIAPCDLQRTQTHGLLGMRQRVVARGGATSRSAAPHRTVRQSA